MNHAIPTETNRAYRAVTTREAIGYIGEGLHTGLRRGTGAPHSQQAWDAVRDSHDDWEALLTETMAALSRDNIAVYAQDHPGAAGTSSTQNPIAAEALNLHDETAAADALHRALTTALNALPDGPLHGALTSPHSGLADATRYLAWGLGVSRWALATSA